MTRTIKEILQFDVLHKNEIMELLSHADYTQFKTTIKIESNVFGTWVKTSS